MLGRYIDKSRFPALLYQLPGSGELGRSFPNFEASWLAQKRVFEVVLYSAKFFYVVPKERGRALSPLNDVRPASCVPRQCRSLYLLLALLWRLPGLFEVFVSASPEPDGGLGREITLKVPVCAHTCGLLGGKITQLIMQLGMSLMPPGARILPKGSGTLHFFTGL